jgi:outer membrane receptor protein involved in Fe transport
MGGKSKVFARPLGISLAACAAMGLATEAWSQVEEIVVTTRKREESLQEVPIAVDAITALDIEQKGIVSLGDVLQQSSSLILDQGFSPQDQRIVIRGLSPTRGRQNIAVLVDDIDISSEAVGTAGGSLLINPRLFDLERVEIVKGPQNALYGRSAFAGAVNYITRKPGDELVGRLGTDLGSNGQLEVSGSIDGPLAENISAGVAGMIWNHDGFYENAITGGDMGTQEGSSVSGTLVWDATDDITITGRIEYLNDEFGVTPFAVGKYANGPYPTLPQFNTSFALPAGANPIFFDPDGPGPAPATQLTSVPGVKGDVPDADDLRAMMSEDPRTGGDYAGTDREITRGTLTIDWDLGAVALKSLTHVATTDTLQQEGAEDVSANSASAVGEVYFDNNTDLFSQELRVLSNTDGPISWAAGGLIWQEDTDVNDGSGTCLNYSGFPFTQPCGPYFANIQNVDPLNPPPGVVPLNADRWTRDTDHWSLYALVEWQFLDSWRIAVEGRYTDEELEVGGPSTDNGIWDPSGILCTFFGAPPCPQIGPGTAAPGGPGTTTVAGLNVGEVDDDFFAPKATLTWTPVDGQLYYFSWARSYKPKGMQAFNAGVGAFNPDLAKFDQEKLEVWELGGKTDWLDNTLRLNGAVFYQDFKNKQVSTQVIDTSGPVPVLTGRTVNAGEAEVWGAEIELTWLATENLSFNLGYTWLDTEYEKYTIFSTNPVKAAYVGNCTPSVQAGRPGCFVDLAGNELEDAPENALVGNVRYERPLVGATNWFVEADAEYQDERFDNDENNLVFPDYWLFDFRAGVSNDKWDIIAYVDNAFDDDTVKTGFADGDIPVFQVGSFAEGIPPAQFFNHATVILPDERQFGLRVNYRFAGE